MATASNVATTLEPGERTFVLLVEDSVPDAQLVEMALEERGLSVEVHRVDSRDAFVAALASRTWDLVLADYNVPSFEGTEALAIARERAPNTPFMFVTGALGEERAIELVKLGATDYVLKDRLNRLGPSVDRALREARAKEERQRAEAALEASERRLKNLMANMPGMAFRCGPREPWAFEYASPGAYELTGYAPEAFYAGGSVTWASLIHPDDRALHAEELEAAADKRRQSTIRYRIRTRGGEEKWVWDRSVGVLGPGGKLESIEGFVTDVTQEMRAEDETRKRVEFEQQLIGIVSHDLRNPLHVIMLAAATILRREDLSEPVTRSILRIHSAGDRASRMIRDLLDFTQTRLGGGIHIERKPVNIQELVQQVVDEAETTHPGRHIRVEHDGESEGEWDPDRLSQAIANLLVNALRHSPSGSQVTVRTLGGEGGVDVEVHNLGEPISAEMRTRLFKPMQRGNASLDRASRSVGLGLYIVDHIVKGHGGHVDVQSSEGDGTSFRIRLPWRAAV